MAFSPTTSRVVSRSVGHIRRCLTCSACHAHLPHSFPVRPTPLLNILGQRQPLLDRLGDGATFDKACAPLFCMDGQAVYEITVSEAPREVRNAVDLIGALKRKIEGEKAVRTSPNSSATIPRLQK